MQPLNALAGFLAVAVATYLLFKGMRLPPTALLFSREDAETFRAQTGRKLLRFLVVANFFGTLTSLATVYVFFIGTSKVFGWYVFAAPITLILGAFVTNSVTKRVFAANPELALARHEGDRAVGVVARVVRSDSAAGIHLSRLVKWLTVASILGVLWLEFSVFADILSSLQSPSALRPGGAAAVLAASALVVCYLILRFGLRGFVFADVLQSPLIIVGTVAVLGAIAWLVSGGSAVTTAAAFVPLAPQPTPWLFVAHVLAVNLAFVLVTEGHWFRLWLFNEEESKRQLPSTIVTASVWALLAAAGCFAATLTTQTGNAGVVDVIHAIANLNGLFAFLFWLAASAALFSTADAQIYSLLVVAAYQPHRGALSDRVDRPNQVFRISLLVAVGFGLVYFPVRHYQVPFETVVFAVTPLAANILPALVATAFRRKPPLFWSYASLVGYLSLTTAGFLRPQDGLVWTLAAAIVPFIVAAIIPFTRRRD